MENNWKIANTLESYWIVECKKCGKREWCIEWDFPKNHVCRKKVKNSKKRNRDRIGHVPAS